MTTRKLLFLAAAAAVTSLSFIQLTHAGPRLDKIMESKVGQGVLKQASDKWLK